MNSFHLSIKTPLHDVVEQDVTELQINTETGRMCVLAGHAALTGSVLFSRAKVVSEKDESEYFVKNGMLYIDPKNNEVSLLCMKCDKVNEITLTSTEDYLKFIAEKLKDKSDLSGYQIQFLEKESFALKKQIDTMK